MMRLFSASEDEAMEAAAGAAAPPILAAILIWAHHGF